MDACPIPRSRPGAAAVGDIAAKLGIGVTDDPAVLAERLQPILRRR